MSYIRGRYVPPDTKLNRPSLPRTTKRPKACAQCGAYLDEVKLAPNQPERCMRCT